MILGDEMGLGKKLVMLITFLTSRQQGDGPAVVVTSGSRQSQWIELIKSHFKPV
jgi:SNF2 family DNA or RNA helicase